MAARQAAQKVAYRIAKAKSRPPRFIWMNEADKVTGGQPTAPFSREFWKTGSNGLPVMADFSYWQCYESATVKVRRIQA